jgi:hypothetical protein
MRLKIATALLAFVIAFVVSTGISMAADEPFSLKLQEGGSIAFIRANAGLDVDEKLFLDLDWSGLAISMDLMGVYMRLGAAIDIWEKDEPASNIGVTAGLGVEWTDIISLVAVVETSGNAYFQKTEDGISGALTAKFAANTAKLAVELNAGAIWPNFDVYPAKMLGQQIWSGKVLKMDPGQAWVELAIAFLSAKGRKDAVKLSYSRDILQEFNRFDVGYNTSFTPDGTGFTLGLYTGIGFGQLIPILNTEFYAQYDITDNIGVMAAVGAQGGLYPMAWFRGKAWAEIEDAAIIELEGKTPIIVIDPLASRLYLEDLSREISLGVSFPQALMSKVLFSYDFNADVFSLEYSLKF